ncbi:MAG: hypothetical protein IJW70_09085 [Clostridia bacterium]|nr:hypothetical protein [Clostridia bacterium]
MKKNLALISMLLVCVMMLASCSSILQVLPAPMTAKQVERRVNIKMADVKSYRVDVEMTYVAYSGTTKITGTAEGIMIEDQGENNDDYYSYVEMVNNMKSNSSSFKIRNVDAYVDGRAFSMFGDGDITRRLYSEMTLKEYNAYRQGESLTEMNLEDCENAEMEKTDSGYVLKYSGYSAEAVEDFAKLSGMEEDVFGKELKDLIVTMEVSKDYLPQKITLEMVFDVEEGSYYQPKSTMTMTYSQFNQAERITRGLNVENYTEIESLSLLKDLQQLIDDRIDAKKGSFTHTASQSVSLMTQSEKSNQTNKVSFERTKDGLTFSADVSSNQAASSHIEYSNGEQHTEINGVSNTTKMKEEKAQAFIAELINDPATGYNTNYVSNIEKTDTGYRVTMAVSKNNALGQSITSTGATFGSGTHTIEFVLDGDQLKCMNVEYAARGAVTLNFGWDTSIATLHLNGSSSVTFE